MKVADILPSQQYYPGQASFGSSASLQQARSFTQDNTISLTTREGDRVNISQSFGSTFEIMANQENNSASSKQSFTAASLNYQSFSFQVEGDLNDQELADITKMVKDLYDIAGNFFSGNTEKALADAGKLGENASTLSKVSASFYQTTMISSYASSFTDNYHPLANFQDQFDQIPAALLEAANGGESGADRLATGGDFVDDLLKAQWRQIADMLDLYIDGFKEDHAKIPAPDLTPPPPVAPGTFAMAEPQEDIFDPNAKQVAPKDSAAPKKDLEPDTAGTSGAHPTKEHARKMMDQVADLLGKHPRLSPFAVPLANHAIDRAGEKNPVDSRQESEQLTARLKADFFNHYNRWLLG